MTIGYVTHPITERLLHDPIKLRKYFKKKKKRLPLGEVLAPLRTPSCIDTRFGSNWLSTGIEFVSGVCESTKRQRGNNNRREFGSKPNETISFAKTIADDLRSTWSRRRTTRPPADDGVFSPCWLARINTTCDLCSDFVNITARRRGSIRTRGNRRALCVKKPKM